MKNPKQDKSVWENRMGKSGTLLSVLVINLVILLLLSGLVVYHFVVPKTEEPMVFLTKVKTTPPPKPPAMSGRSGAKTALDPAPVMAAPPLETPSVISISSPTANFTPQSIQPVNSISLPMVSMPQGTTLDQTASTDSGTSNSGGSNPFGSTSADNGPALVGYLYDLKRNSDGSATSIKDDGYFKDRSLEKTYEARWHWGRYVLSFANDPAKKDQLTDSMINEANIINSLISERNTDSLLTPYYKSKPLYAYQWSIGIQSPPSIVKAFGVANEVKPTHIVIFYKGTVVAPVSGSFRFISFSAGGAMAVRFNNELVAGHGNWENPLISPKPFNFGGDLSCLINGETAGKWFDVIQGQQYPIQILLTAGDGGTSLHLMIQQKQPDQPYLQGTIQWDTYKQRANPRIPLRFPLFALQTGIPAAPYTPPPMNPPHPPPAEAPDDVKQSFERNGPSSANPEVAPDPFIFPGIPNQ